MGREKLDVVTSFCYLGTTYRQVSVANSLLSQDVVLHVGKFNELLPAYSPSPPEVELTIRVSGMPYSMKAKSGSQRYVTCIACNVTAEL